MENRQDPERIAEEVVGQRHDSMPPDEVREREQLSPEETARRIARSVGPQASVPEKTAESVGERVGDAYSDPGSATPRLKRPVSEAAGAAGFQPDRAAHPVPAAGRQPAEIVSAQFSKQSFMMTVASFAAGYITAMVLNGRIKG